MSEGSGRGTMVQAGGSRPPTTADFGGGRGWRRADAEARPYDLGPWNPGLNLRALLRNTGGQGGGLW